MNTTESIQVKQAVKVSPQIQWVNKNFVQNQPKCFQENQAVFICTHNKCKKQNPFVCITLECKCRQWHENCSIRNIQSFVREFQSRYQSFSTQLENTIQESMDKLIEAISIAKQSFLDRLRQQKANCVLSKDKQARTKNIQQLLKKKFTGSLIYQLSNPDIMNENNEWLLKFNNQFTQIVNQFEKNKLKPFLSRLDEVLFFSVDKVIWSRTLKDDMNINNKCVSRTGNANGQRRIALLEPEISKLYGAVIKWSINIKWLSNANSWVGLGICLRQSIKKKNFKFDRNDQCYMISNNQKIYDAIDYNKNDTNGYGIEFLKNDVIEMELDRIKWILKFENLRTSKSTKLKITKIPEPNEDDYHICVALNNRDDQVEIISPIQTSLYKYFVSNN